MTDQRQVWAAFDFDGTITKRDSLVPFLRRVAGRRAFAAAVPRVAITAFSPTRGADRDKAKAALLQRLLAGRDSQEIDEAADHYATELPNTYQPATLAHIARHRDEGHRLVLVSASLGVYARPAALALGFEQVIAVELASDSSGRLTGQMTGPNVRGTEKATRLREHVTPHDMLWAYGNSSSDEAMLALADHPIWVGRRG